MSEQNQSASGELMLRAFGPFADAVAIELAKAPEFVVRNLQRLAELVTRKRRGRASGYSSPRLLKKVIDEAGWADDEIVTEYLAGVLAASTDTTEADRAIFATNLVKSLSNLQLRAHFTMYANLAESADVSDSYDLRSHENRIALHVDLDIDEFLTHLGIDAPNLPSSKKRVILDHVVMGLALENLIDNNSWGYSVTEEPGNSCPVGQMNFHPSPRGAELFLWGIGADNVDQAELFTQALEIPLERRIDSIRFGDYWEQTNLVDSACQESLLSGDYVSARERVRVLQGIDSAHPSPYFYRAVLAVLEKTDEEELELMEAARKLASPEQIDAGLRTLDSVMIRNPSVRNELMDLALVLAPSHPRTS